MPEESHLFQGLLFSPQFTDTLSFADNTPTMDLFTSLMKVSERRGATQIHCQPNLLSQAKKHNINIYNICRTDVNFLWEVGEALDGKALAVLNGILKTGSLSRRNLVNPNSKVMANIELKFYMQIMLEVVKNSLICI